MSCLKMAAVLSCDKGMMGDHSNEHHNDSAEKFLLRVLLVESDDSTRQIISALLRKCSYKVAAVPDGLKAWETLKKKAPDIDLILTEVELPSISGFSLLTLIMEHDICKNIPVIMMSSHDSVSMVYKCMLKGAADFLIKPIRRNELRNLWQHVWRRHAISRTPQKLTLPQNKLEVTAENNAASNNSSGSVAFTQKNNECSEKTSEAQDTSQLKSSSNFSKIDTGKYEEYTNFGWESAKHNSEAGEKSIVFVSEAARCNKSCKSTSLRLGQGYDYSETENQDEVVRIELSKANLHISTEIHGCIDDLVEPSTGAIDLIATFENLPKSTDENRSFNGDNTAKFDFDTQLGLSIRSDFTGSSCKPANEERQILNHSNASAFSWYGSSKLLQPLFPTSSITSAKLTNTSWNSHESHELSENINTSHPYGGKNHYQENMTSSVVIDQSGNAEPNFPNSQLGFFPDTGVTSDHKSVGHGNVFPSIPYAQSGCYPIWTPKPLCQKESSPFPACTSSQSNPESHDSERYHWSDDATYTCDQNVNDQRNLDCVTHDAPAAGQSSGTSFYHDVANHNSSGVYESIGSGSDGNATSAVVSKNIPESFIDSGRNSYDEFRTTNSHQSSQREAALTKFRLKRKDRCYEKKVLQPFYYCFYKELLKLFMVNVQLGPYASN
ncbi:two-component response regulator-like PRR95 isoform X2 [Gastrolobium bilobum]|uniref:two-component response regulator-like PRR95 isoform X2 n=1 Tax=Gastrolobium bilobum TaxID=150636 RepID=UPI002AAF4AC0|nr:two-component response regulator-like PRR95 isoform X2 [Gastrolobium bilobum]